jgi:hypothetical protein
LLKEFWREKNVKEKDPKGTFETLMHPIRDTQIKWRV